jgi:hypothetical protein
MDSSTVTYDRIREREIKDDSGVLSLGGQTDVSDPNASTRCKSRSRG